MTRARSALAAVLLVAVMVGSAVALPILGGGLGPFDGGGPGTAEGDGVESGEASLEDAGTGAETELQAQSDANGTDGAAAAGDGSTGEVLAMDAPVALEALDAGGTSDAVDEASASTSAEPDEAAATQASLAQDRQDAVEAGVEAGIELAQSQGVEVTQEQRAGALEGASQAAAQHQEADVEQVQEATKGAVHGSVMQEQDVNATQIQHAVGGATDGALAQHQTVNASQMQSATWGATHGAMAQSQRVTVEQVQVAAYGAAAGAASEAGDKGVDRKPKIQEAAQGAAYGVLSQYQKITVEQRQQVTLEHVQHSAAGAAAGALEGSTEAVLEQEQSVDVEQEQSVDAGQEQSVDAEQRQRVDIKQIQKAATGAAKGALVQRQQVTVEQTQSAARGAGKGSLKQVQSVSVEQIQRISITQIQEASFGASKGAIEQSQEATVEQIQAAADGAAQGSLVQRQEVSIAQIQHAATGASKGAVESAIQQQIVEVEQIQAAARGAGEGAVTQTQVVDVTQVQTLAQGGSSGALSQYQEASVTQIQIAARSACEETARVVQNQRISITQLQTLTQETAADATQYAVSEGTDDPAQIVQHVEIEVVQRIEQVDELEGTAAISFSDQESDGERVVVDDVELSEGGFVAVYDGVAVDADPEDIVGVSDYLEAGEHEDLEVDLDEPLEESRPLVAVVHHDTNGDGTFDYAETDGAEDEPYVAASGGPVLDGAFVTVAEQEPDPEATLEVSDQEGDGETLVVDEANASVDYTVSAEYDGERVDSEVLAANETAEDLALDLEPPLEENTTVDVSVRAAADDAELANETVEYTLADEPDSDAVLEVTDQEGDGETLLIDEANASVDYTVSAEYNGERVDSEFFEANDSATAFELDLEPPIEENTTVDVSVRDAANDTELANETVEYTLADEPDSDAVLEVTDQTGDGETLTIGETNASVEYVLTAAADGEQLVETEPFAPNEGLDNETVELDQPLADNATVDVALEATGDGETLANESIEYVVDRSFQVEFTSCTRAEVSGSFADGERIGASTGFYTAGGYGNTILEDYVAIGEDVDAPFTGTIVFDVDADEDVAATGPNEITVGVDDYGDFGTTISGISSPEAFPYAGIDHPHPNAQTCLEETRPEQPEIAVADATPLEGDGAGGDALDGAGEDGAIEVTFAYTNPNDASLFVDSEFVEGTTDDEPPSELEPGEGEFTVEWTPDSDDERLAWEVDMRHYDYDEVLTAETATAGEIDPSEPAEYAVSIVGTNDPVEQGEPLEIDAEIENVGDEAGEQNVTLSLDGTETDATAVTLAGDETETVTLTAATDDLEPGEYTATVASENDTAETDVTVEEAGEPAEFEVSDVSTDTADPDPAPGDEVTVSATITNVGDLEGTQTVTYTVDGSFAGEQDVTLAGGESATVSFTATLPEGESTHTIETADDLASVTLEATAETGLEGETETETDDGGVATGDETGDGPTEEPTDDGPDEPAGDPLEEPDGTTDAETEPAPTDETTDTETEQVPTDEQTEPEPTPEPEPDGTEPTEPTTEPDASQQPAESNTSEATG